MNVFLEDLLTYVLSSSHPGEEVENVFIFLRDGHLRLDEVEEEGGGHDGPAVDHGVVGLPVVVHHDLVELPAAGFPPDVLLDHGVAELLQTEAVGEGFTKDRITVLAPLTICYLVDCMEKRSLESPCWNLWPSVVQTAMPHLSGSPLAS